MRHARPRPVPPNAFDREFLDRLGELDEPETVEEVDLAGPWKVVAMDGGFGLFRLWESPEAGHEPFVLCTDEAVALRFLAMLPACGRDPFYRAAATQAKGYELQRQGTTVAWMPVFHEKLLLLMHGAECLAHSPYSLATLLRSTGPLAMCQTGEILHRETAGRDEAGEPEARE